MLTPRYRSPAAGLAGRAEDALANAEAFRRTRRAVFSRLPFPVLESDVRDVVYASWIVETAALADRIPPGVKVREVDGRTVLTLLAYDHGHFGPADMEPVRRLFPSPRQANWRLYVEEIDGAAPAVPTVLFLANVFDSLLYAVGTRLFSDVMLSQRAASFEHGVTEAGWATSARCSPGTPSWRLGGRSGGSARLPEEFAPFFGTFDAALQDLCLQDAAIAPVVNETALAWSGIDLPIATASIRPLIVEDYRPCDLLRQWGAEASPFCFHVPAVRFRVLGESLLAR